MMAVFILVLSVAALLQFFVSYCRSLLAASMKHVLSAEVQDVTGISGATVGEDFPRVAQLLQLCPDRPEERSGMKAVGAYFNLLGFLRNAVTRFVPSWLTWTDAERAQCTYFAAVTLDRRIAFSRDLFAQQMDT